MCESNDEPESERKYVQKISGFRRILPQVIATTIENLHVIEVGLILAMPAIIIAALSGIPNEPNRNESLSINGAQASWIGELVDSIRGKKLKKNCFDQYWKITNWNHFQEVSHILDYLSVH